MAEGVTAEAQFTAARLVILETRGEGIRVECQVTQAWLDFSSRRASQPLVDFRCRGDLSHRRELAYPFRMGGAISQAAEGILTDPDIPAAILIADLITATIMTAATTDEGPTATTPGTCTRIRT